MLRNIMGKSHIACNYPVQLNYNGITGGDRHTIANTSNDRETSAETPSRKQNR